MTEQRLLEDVNLSEIRFGGDGRSVALIFLNMSDGAEVGTLSCTGLAFFGYSMNPDNSLPQYVGEVNCIPLLDADQASRILKRLGYGYRDFTGVTLVGGLDKLSHVQVEGGFTLEIVCREATLTRGNS